MLRISVIISAFFLQILIFSFAWGVEYEWRQFDHLERITDIAIKGDTAWIGSDIGLGKMSLTTRKPFFYNYVNSGNRINYVNDVAIDRNDNKWIATPNGIVRFDGIHWDYFDTSNSILNSSNVRQIVIDSNYTKWFLCSPNVYWSGSTTKFSGGGIAYFNGNSWKLLDSIDLGLSTSEIKEMTAGRHGLWLLTRKGICSRINDSTWKYYTIPGIPESIIPLKIQADPKGTIWVLSETTGGGLDTNFLSGIDTAGNWTTFRINDSLPKGMKIELNFSIDPSGKFWFSSQDFGIVVWDHQSWKPYNYKNSEFPKNPFITFVAFDKMGLMYFNRLDDTLRIFDNPTVTKLQIQPSPLPFSGLISMAQDKKGFYWIGSTNGVIRMRNDTFTVFDTSNSGLVYNFRIKVAIDSLNRKWFGSNCRCFTMGHRGLQAKTAVGEFRDWENYFWRKIMGICGSRLQVVLR